MAKLDFVNRYKAPIRGLNTSVPETDLTPDSGFVPQMTNFLPNRAFVQKRQGLVELLAAPPGSGNFMEAVQYGDASGNLHLMFARTSDLIEYVLGTPDTWVDRTATPLTGNASNPIFFAVVGGAGATNLFSTNFVDNIKTWTGTGNISNLTTTGFTTLRSLTIAGYKSYLILGNTNEDGTLFPYRVRWSEAGSPTAWTVTSTNTAGFVDLIEDDENSKIQALVPLRTVLVAYKEGAVYNLKVRTSGTGGFQADPIITTRGAISPKGVAPVRDGNRHLVVSEDNIFIYDGFSFEQPPIGDRIKQDFFDDLNWGARGTIFAKSFPNRFECWIAYPSGAATEPDKAYCYNWLYDTWTFHDFGRTINSFMYINRFFNSDPKPLLGSSSGNLYEMFQGTSDAGTPINASFRFPLKEFVDTQREQEGILGRPGKQRIWQVEIDSDNLPKFSSVGVDNLIDTPTEETAKAFVDRNNIHIVESENRNATRYVATKIVSDTAQTLKISEVREHIHTHGGR